MESPVVKIPARVDKDHSTASRMEMELITLQADSLMCVTNASEEILEDSRGVFFDLLKTSGETETRELLERQHERIADAALDLTLVIDREHIPQLVAELEKVFTDLENERLDG